MLLGRGLCDVSDLLPAMQLVSSASRYMPLLATNTPAHCCRPSPGSAA